MRMCFFKLLFAVNDLLQNLCGLHDLCEYVISNGLHEHTIYHKIHIFNLCGHHELCDKYVSSNFLLQKMIYHKIHICGLCGLHELCGCVSSNDVFGKMHMCLRVKIKRGG